MVLDETDQVSSLSDSGLGGAGLAASPGFGAGSAGLPAAGGGVAGLTASAGGIAGLAAGGVAAGAAFVAGFAGAGAAGFDSSDFVQAAAPVMTNAATIPIKILLNIGVSLPP
ncbi:MAG TPA: hypothetical protein VN634_13620 [Candidatus Limnocylindrales bacterium]|nr:hypothetical protein [Candidatus Limnocylindrales bacterium]